MAKHPEPGARLLDCFASLAMTISVKHHEQAYGADRQSAAKDRIG